VCGPMCDFPATDLQRKRTIKLGEREFVTHLHVFA
jgi:hypothetical protein